MARGGARVGSGRKRKVQTEALSAREVIVAAEEHSAVGPSSEDGLLPLDYMLRVIRDPATEESRRDRMAVAAAPYLHAKAGEAGKKEMKKGAAERVTGKFAQAAPPKLIVNNR